MSCSFFLLSRKIQWAVVCAFGSEFYSFFSLHNLAHALPQEPILPSPLLLLFPPSPSRGSGSLAFSPYRLISPPSIANAAKTGKKGHCPRTFSSSVTRKKKKKKILWSALTPQKQKLTKKRNRGKVSKSPPPHPPRKLFLRENGVHLGVVRLSPFASWFFSDEERTRRGGEQPEGELEGTRG